MTVRYILSNLQNNQNLDLELSDNIRKRRMLVVVVIVTNPNT